MLDEASVTFRPPSGYYGQFCDKDSSYVDHKDFDNNSKNNQFSDPDADEMVLGDEMLQSNITKQISLLEEDDIDVMSLKLPLHYVSHQIVKEEPEGEARDVEEAVEELSKWNHLVQT